MSILLNLFITFLKVGLFTFGGGYAMISVIENACVQKQKWISKDEMLDIIVIAESTPGPISVNTATYVGFLQKGIIGSFIATLGLILPSFLIIYFISLYFDNFLEISFIANAFKGIKIGVGVMIFDAGLNMYKNLSTKTLIKLIFLFSFFLMLYANIFSSKISSITIIIFVAICVMLDSVEGITAICAFKPMVIGIVFVATIVMMLNFVAFAR